MVITRRVVKNGASRQVTLPKYWVERHIHRTEVEMIISDNGDLVVKSQSPNENQVETIAKNP